MPTLKSAVCTTLQQSIETTQRAAHNVAISTAHKQTDFAAIQTTFAATKHEPHVTAFDRADGATIIKAFVTTHCVSCITALDTAICHPHKTAFRTAFIAPFASTE